MIEICILLNETVILPFCTPVLIGPQVVPFPSFNRLSAGSEIKSHRLRSAPIFCKFRMSVSLTNNLKFANCLICA